MVDVLYHLVCNPPHEISTRDRSCLNGHGSLFADAGKAGMVVFVLSQQAGHATGQSVCLDGGVNVSFSERKP